MSDFIIMSDTTCDLPDNYLSQYNIPILPLRYTLGDTTYGSELNMEYSEFYKRMRNGELPTTSACNPDDAETCFRRYLDQGKDILHISFSSALSSSYNTCAIVARDLSSEYPNNKIIVIDSKCASMGEGLYVDKAVKLRNDGFSIEDTAAWLEEHKLNFCHQFTVDDLHNLYRGGRVSKATAIVGTLINVKPILHVDDEGRLIPLSNVRGRKRSLTTLVDNMEKSMSTYNGDKSTVFIGHGDCIEDAEFVANLVKERFGITDIMINFISPTIGTHSGPGTLALFFMGTTR